MGGRRESRCTIVRKHVCTCDHQRGTWRGIDFFKSTGKTIKTNRTSIADVGVVDVYDEETYTHYTGNYTSNSCGEETRYVNWIEGDALRMRIELKFRLIRERMLAPEASNSRRLRT